MIEVETHYRALRTLFAGRRVLELDAVAATGGRSAALLLDLGAASVVASDADAEAVARAKGALAASSALSFAEAAALPGDCDVVVVHGAARVAAAVELAGKVAVVVLIHDGAALAEERSRSASLARELEVLRAEAETERELLETTLDHSLERERRRTADLQKDLNRILEVASERADTIAALTKELKERGGGSAR
jgi:hypothetical protein